MVSSMTTAAHGRGVIECDLFLDVLRSFGAARLAVTGTSMLPSVRPGDVLEVRRQSAAEVMPGDLVLFQREGRFFAHRVVEKIRRQGRTLLVTRGDRLLQCDPPVSPEELLGRVAFIVRGDSHVVPRLTRWGRIASWALSRSDLATRLLLRWRAGRDGSSGRLENRDVSPERL